MAVRVGLPLGTLCVIDRVPGALTAAQRRALALLARRVMAQIELYDVASRLAQALADVEELAGLLPVCAHCSRVRDDSGYWSRVDRYLRENVGLAMSHGICPDCLDEHHPDVDESSP